MSAICMYSTMIYIHCSNKSQVIICTCRNKVNLSTTIPLVMHDLGPRYWPPSLQTYDYFGYSRYTVVRITRSNTFYVLDFSTTPTRKISIARVITVWCVRKLALFRNNSEQTRVLLQWSVRAKAKERP